MFPAVAVTVLALSLAQTKMSPPRPWRPPAVKLLTAGAPPLLPLRYALARGGTGQLTLEAGGRWRLKTSSNQANTQLPSLDIRFTYSVDAPDRFSFEFLTATATGSGAENDLATQGVLAALQGVSGTVQFDARGLAQKLSIRPSANDPEFSQDNRKVTVGTHYALEVARSAFMHLFTPFPDEPLGIGGTWQIERPQTRGTISYTEVATFTLVSRDASGAHLELRLGGKPDPLSGIHPAQIDLLVSGGGKADIEFARPFPVSLDDQVTIHAVTGPQDAQRVEHEGAMTGRLQLAKGKSP